MAPFFRTVPLPHTRSRHFAASSDFSHPGRAWEPFMNINSLWVPTRAWMRWRSGLASSIGTFMLLLASWDADATDADADADEECTWRMAPGIRGQNATACAANEANRVVYITITSTEDLSSSVMVRLTSSNRCCFQLQMILYSTRRHTMARMNFRTRDGKGRRACLETIQYRKSAKWSQYLFRNESNLETRREFKSAGNDRAFKRLLHKYLKTVCTSPHRLIFEFRKIEQSPSQREKNNCNRTTS
jgi:hypothetical protein